MYIIKLMSILKREKCNFSLYPIVFLKEDQDKLSHDQIVFHVGNIL